MLALRLVLVAHWFVTLLMYGTLGSNLGGTYSLAHSYYLLK